VELYRTVLARHYDDVIVKPRYVETLAVKVKLSHEKILTALMFLPAECDVTCEL